MHAIREIYEFIDLCDFLKDNICFETEFSVLYYSLLPKSNTPYPLSLVLSLPLQLNRSLHAARCQHTDVLSATSCPVFQGTQCELLVQKYVGPFPFSVNGSDLCTEY